MHYVQRWEHKGFIRIITAVTHPIVNHGLPRMLELLLEAVALQDVDDAQIQHQSLALGVARGNTSRPAKRGGGSCK